MKYQKRIRWDRYRPEFLKLGFVMALAIVFMAFNYTTTQPQFEPFEIEIFEPDVLLTPPITMHKKKVLPPPPPPPDLNNVADIIPVDEPIIKFERKLEVIERKEPPVDAPISEDIIEEGPIVAPIIETEEKEEAPLLFAERMPVYGSCDLDLEESDRRSCTEQNLVKHIYENVRYPAMAREGSIEGTVVVSFVVNKEGKVQDIEIMRDIGAGCGDEVERVIRKLGRFLPGKMNGRPVAIIYRMPVKFKLE